MEQKDMVYYGMVKGCALEVTRMYGNKIRLHLAVETFLFLPCMRFDSSKTESSLVMLAELEHVWILSSRYQLRFSFTTVNMRNTSWSTSFRIDSDSSPSFRVPTASGEIKLGIESKQAEQAEAHLMSVYPCNSARAGSTEATESHRVCFPQASLCSCSL